MKTGTAVLLVFIGASLALALVLTGGHALIVWGRMLDPAFAEQPYSTLAAHLADSLPGILLISAVAAAAVALFRLLQQRTSPVPSLILLWVTLSVFLYGTLELTYRFASHTVAAEPTAQALPHGRLLRLPDAALYIDERTGETLRRVLVRRQFDSADQPRFVLYPEARHDPRAEVVVLPGEAEPLSLRELRDGPWAALDVPPAAASLMREAGWVSGRLRSGVAPPSVAGILSVLALSLAVTMSWTLVRLTRWPLFNAILTVSWLRLLLHFAAAPSDPALMELLREIISLVGAPTGYLYPAALALPGLILLGLGVVLPSFQQWKRETYGE